MARIKLGDVFSIETSKGKAYLQLVFDDPELSQIIRVLPGLHANPVDNIEEMVNSMELFYVQFQLKGAVYKKIVEKVGGYLLPKWVEKPKFMRTNHVIGGEFLGWHIVNTETWQRELVKELSDKQKKLSPWGIWSDALLIERLEKGWTPEKETEKYI